MARPDAPPDRLSSAGPILQIGTMSLAAVNPEGEIVARYRRLDGPA